MPQPSVPTPSAWQAAGNYFDFNGHPVFFRDSGGELPALLLIHGFPTASWDWAPMWDKLSQHFRLIAPDMLGFGFSAKPKHHQYDLIEQADIHLALLKQLGINEYHALVHDYGVSVMQELIARQREQAPTPRIHSACFLNGGLFPALHRPQPIQRLLISPLGPLLSRLTSKGQFKRSFSKVFGVNSQPSEFELDGFWELIQQQQGHRIMHRLMRYMVDRKKHEQRWCDAILNPGIPVRLINGSQDPVSGKHLADYYRRTVNNPDVISLAEVGHYPQVEAPDVVSQHFLAFNPVTAPAAQSVTLSQ